MFKFVEFDEFKKYSKTIIHDLQQIKTGDEWSKKREHQMMKKLGEIEKTIKKLVKK